MKSKITLIGIGHPFRGDDALGPLIIEKLSAQLPNFVETKTSQGDMAELLNWFDQKDTVMIVDAIQTNQNPPGTCYQFNHSDVTQLSACRVSTHAFDLGQTLALADNLGILPVATIIFGIEAQHFGHGQTLSAPVADAVPKLSKLIMQAIKDMEQDKCMK